MGAILNVRWNGCDGALHVGLVTAIEGANLWDRNVAVHEGKRQAHGKRMSFAGIEGAAVA
jgi:hypothetical protein